MHRSEGRGDRRRRRERRIVGLAFFLLTDIQDRHEIREIRTGEDAMRRTGIFSRLAMVAGALLLSGCPGPPAPSAAGTLSVRMVDAGLPGLAGVYVTVGHIDVHPQGGNWKTVLIPQTTVNLLELVNGVQVGLGLADLPAGPYTELRLVLGSIPDDTLNILAAPTPTPTTSSTNPDGCRNWRCMAACRPELSWLAASISPLAGPPCCSSISMRLIRWKKSTPRVNTCSNRPLKS